MKISHSACQKYLNCGYEYFLHYYRKLRPVDDKSSFVFGDAIDAGLNHLLETKDLAAATLKFQERWEARAKAGNLTYAKSDLDEHLVEGMIFSSEKEKLYTAVRLRGEILLREYNEQIIPRIKKVIKVQIDEVMSNDSNDELVIKTDFICEWEDGRIILFDNKTSTIKYEANSVAESAQLAIYNEALAEEYKIQACGYIVVPKKTNKFKKPQVKIEVIIDNISQETVDKTYQDFVGSLEGIKAGHFPKNESNCISKYGKCQYYNYCHNGDSTGLKEKVEK